MQQKENIADTEFGEPVQVLTRRLQVNRYCRSAVLNIPAVLVRKCRLSDKDLMKFEVIEDEDNTRLIISRAKVS